MYFIRSILLTATVLLTAWYLGTGVVCDCMNLLSLANTFRRAYGRAKTIRTPWGAGFGLEFDTWALVHLMLSPQ